MTVNASIVDPNSRCSAVATIYKDADGLQWTYMLNLTDITFGTFGNNKFYMAQLIQDRGNFVVFRRWGRVGDKSPQCSIENHRDSLKSAMSEFKRVFASKSGNRWPLKKPFEKKKSKYVLIELDEDESGDKGESKDITIDNSKSLPCSLPPPIRDFLQLISDPKALARDMEAMNIDLKRMPLGKLSKAQISQGYTILRQISSTIEEIAERSPTSDPTPSTRRRRGRKKNSASQAQAANASAVLELQANLQTLSSDFYTLIPHDFGRSLPPVLESMEAVKEKLDLLEMLSNVGISQELGAVEKVKKENKKDEERESHPLDTRYEAIGAEMEPVDPTGDEFKLIERFVTTTCSAKQLPSIFSVLKVARPAEEANADVFQSVDNHQLLWHGSRLSNIVGILSQGLRIAPPEAPANGYNFGKGLYFADALAKSSAYCYASQTHRRGVLFLVEVALGKQYKTPERESLDYAKLKDTYGCDSTHGVGKVAPREDACEIMSDGVAVPIGELKPIDGRDGFLYNEFIVYRPEQVKLRYALTVDF